MSRFNRRQVLAGLPISIISMAAALKAPAAMPSGSAPGLTFGPPAPFSFDALRARALALARKPYVAPHLPAQDIVRRIDYDTNGKIKFRASCALSNGAGDANPIRFFHLDMYNHEPVKIFAIDGNTAREVLYSRSCFDYGGTGFGKLLPANLGYAGFRVMNGAASDTDWLAFLGASYFRSAGQEQQYGASARGVAVDCGMINIIEEFPRFTEFWLDPSVPAPAGALIYALLEGPSLTGAFRFTATHTGPVVMDIHAELFLRKDIRRLGIAPLTSMYWYGENERSKAVDWRPEVHDSDSLVLWTGRGERICRPLINPPAIQTNAFLDRGPKGFGLMQRDRNFDDYQDDGAFYNRRPSVWVEPIGDWGEGEVQLVELPTTDEVHDNIVAYWVRKAPARRGDTIAYDYRLYWQDHEPNRADDVGRVVATRLGRGGAPGRPEPGDARKTKFVIDFAGGALETMHRRYDVKPIITAPHARVSDAFVTKVAGTKRWRAFFDVRPLRGGPINLRCYLRLGSKTLSETWLYQWYPGL